MAVMAVVMIGVDPHKAAHTAVAISAAEEPLGQLRVRASAVQAERLLAWAARWPERAWAVEGAGGLGHLLARQLVAAGELVPACSRSWRPGSGCWSRGIVTRTTRTTPGRWRSRHCGRRPGG